MSIIGTGISVPNKKIDNSYFKDVLKLNTSEEWINSKIGIKNRYYAEGENLLSLISRSAGDALNMAKLDHVDTIIVATSTPDTQIPSMASFLAGNLGIECCTFDINNACSGFVTAFDVSLNYLKENQYKNALVIGADLATKVVDFSDRLTSVFFGDGAGSVILSNNIKKLSSYSKTHSCHEAISTVNNQKLSMEGKKIWEFTHEIVPHIIKELAKRANISINKINWVVPHQPNLRMLESCFKSMDFDLNKVIINADKYGNTIAATIPIAIHENKGKFNKKEIICLIGWGAGLSCYGVLFEY
jgi:3-oxoacyl-[acyl-carrier-protein] synthase-3